MQPSTEPGHSPADGPNEVSPAARATAATWVRYVQALLPSFPPSPPTCHFFWQAWIDVNYRGCVERCVIWIFKNTNSYDCDAPIP